MSTIEHVPQPGPLVAVATRSHKAVNQDAAVIIGHTRLPLTGVAVADGLGSHYGAGTAARAAAAAAAATLESLVTIEHVCLPAVFADARQAIEAAVGWGGEPLPGGLNLAAAFGTTLLCGLDLPDRLVAAYVGNGAIIHLRGDFSEFPPTQLMPWNACNYLNPHSRMGRGTNVLYKWLGPQTTMTQSSPTVIEIRKDDLLFGDLLLVCSDGISSLDQTPIGLDGDQRMWIQADRSLAMLYDHLKQFVGNEPLTSEALTVCLERYLDDLDARQLIGDDCTVGAIVSAAAVQRYESRRRAVEPVAV
jgi:serine/threonine protein phosphatase PrpC